jgi:hypothetical protein
MYFSYGIVQYMITNIIQFLSQYPLNGTDAVSIKEWKKSCLVAWNSTVVDYLSQEESHYSSSILSTLLANFDSLAQLTEEKKRQTATVWSMEQRRASIQSLLSRPQFEQRTEAWYLDALGLLSASQFSIILKNTRSRGQLVLQKAICTPIDTSARKTVVLTEDLNPFTWGIRFEPVVKQIYQHLTETTVVDLGRLKHADDPRLAASPDGLIVEGPDKTIGRFVEFKAPVTRQILNKVPEEYMAQMQIQMEVGCVEECDYLEVKFQSKYNASTWSEIPDDAAYKGTIYIIGDEEGQLLRYEYSPLQLIDWLPNLQGTEQLLERIPWWTSKWFLKTVGRSREWFASVQPAIQSFWEDVQKAKEGTFVLQESSRKPKDPVCKIIIEQEEEQPQMQIEPETT